MPYHVIPYDVQLANTDQVLVGTAEVPMAAMHAQHTYNVSDLPLKYVAFGHAFRTEAGEWGVSYGM